MGGRSVMNRTAKDAEETGRCRIKPRTHKTRYEEYRSTATITVFKYRGAEKSLARPTSRCILFDGQNISFDVSLVIYINSTNIPPIMIINRIYETQNLLSL